MKKEKLLGQVFTPEWIVKYILDQAGYYGKDILNKYILEPSFGRGAFLLEIVERYILAAQAEKLSNKQIIKHLSTYIYGIEIDPVSFDIGIEELNKLCKKYNLEEKVEWQFIKGSTLNFYKKYNKFFDWIVGNPPYIRVHNLNIEIREIIKKEFHFVIGTSDLYLTFFEMSFFMLKDDGKFGFITPNSFLYNSSYMKFRDYLQKKRNIKTLCDLQEYKVFKGFSTYTAIIIIDNSIKSDDFEYKEFVKGNFITVNHVNFSKLDSKKWILANQEENHFLDNLYLNKNKRLADYFEIQYGFATLRDRIFIGDFIEDNDKYGYFNGKYIEKNILHKIVKGSRYKGDKSQWVIFPYYRKDNRYLPYSEKELSEKYPLAYHYFLENKEELLARNRDKNSQWFEFGRSQGIQNSYKEKIVLSTLVLEKVDFYFLPKDTFVYSGIFITKKVDDIDWKIIEDTLSSEEFYQYIRLTGKDFSGGYKSMSSKQIKDFPIEEHN